MKGEGAVRKDNRAVEKERRIAARAEEGKGKGEQLRLFVNKGGLD